MDRQRHRVVCAHVQVYVDKVPDRDQRRDPDEDSQHAATDPHPEQRDHEQSRYDVTRALSLNFSPVEKIKAALHGIKVVSSISYAKGEERPYGNRVYNRTNGISATGAAPSDREI